MTQDTPSYTSNSRPRTAGHIYNEALKAAKAAPTADMLRPAEQARASHMLNLGIYSPVTGNWMVPPSRPNTAGPKDYSLPESYRRQMKSVAAPGQAALDPITQTQAKFVTVDAPAAPVSKMDGLKNRDPGWHHDHDRGRARPAMIDVQGDYNPVTGTWRSRPTDAKREDREVNYYKTYGSTKRHVHYTQVSKRMGIYDPVKGCWIQPPLDKKIVNGHTIGPRNGDHHF